VPFTNCFNVRDMGGWRTEDGRRLRWRPLYRGDTLHHLDGEELEALAGLGLRTATDLRTETELDPPRRFPPATPATPRLRIPLTAESRAARYDWLAVHDPDYLAFLQSLPPEALEVRAEAIEAMLDRLRTDHGSVADYLTAGGVSPEAIERLGDALLEG